MLATRVLMIMMTRMELRMMLVLVIMLTIAAPTAIGRCLRGTHVRENDDGSSRI